MTRRNPTPRCWLMTDERAGDRLIPALLRLPPGSGVVFRHYSLPPRERRLLFVRVRRIARARGIRLAVAAPRGLGRGDGTHGVRTAGVPVLTWPAHDRRQAVAGSRAGRRVALIVSPVHATRSHAGAAGLGPAGAAGLTRGLRRPTIALGGMTDARFRAARRLGFRGWAAIDALH